MVKTLNRLILANQHQISNQPVGGSEMHGQIYVDRTSCEGRNKHP